MFSIGIFGMEDNNDDASTQCVLFGGGIFRFYIKLEIVYVTKTQRTNINYTPRQSGRPKQYSQ